MRLEWAAEVLRGWPADGARERSELVKQGAVLVNGDVVTIQPDGTVDKVGATKTRLAGLVVRGNGDSASAANASGAFMSPQTAVALSGIVAAAGSATATSSTNHGYKVGDIVVIAAATGNTTVNGTFAVATVPSLTTFTYVGAAITTGAVTGSPTATLQTPAFNNTGKAVVLWGNYIVRTSKYNASPAIAYAPGNAVTAANGVWDSSAAAGDIAGYILRVQGATATESAHLVISAY